MARIKFLDVLEETKSQSTYRNPDFEEKNIYTHKNRGDFMHQEEFNIPQSNPSVNQERAIRRERFSESDFTPARRREVRKNHSDISDHGNSRLAFETGYHGRRTPASSMKQAGTQNSGTGIFGIEDNRTLWTGALFVFFGGMLFLSGYWLGKTITGRVKAEGISALTQAERDYRREELNNRTVSNVPVVTPTIAATVDQTAPPAPVKKVAKPVDQTAPPAAPKTSSNNKEFVIQVSAHSTIESARTIEDKLRAAGYSAYTSESSVGDAVYFRVRIRGFNSKNDAASVLNKIKLLDIGNDGYVLSLE